MLTSDNHHDNLDIQKTVQFERQFIHETMISMIKKYLFIYDPFEPVEGNRKKSI